jgi:seryl-tRNA synthetase
MLDLKFIKENLEAVEANIRNRFMDADAKKVVALADDRSQLIQSIEKLRTQRNENAKAMKQKLSTDERNSLIDEGKTLKQEISQLETKLSTLESNLQEEWKKIPNMTFPGIPVGKEDKDNLQIKVVGDRPEFSFKPKDHVELGESLDIIDFEAGTRVAGPKFYYLKNEGALLEMALVRFAIDKIVSRGFIPTITPDIAKLEVAEGTGFNPRGAESNIYTIEGTDSVLVGTAEITLGGYHYNQIVDLSNGPIKYAGFSHCFRKEAGAAGQYSKGLYRVHQFSKVELFVLCKPEESDAIHEELREIEEEIFNSLKIPFRVVDTCTGDLGAPAYRKYDLEAWMPGRGNDGDWGEITSTSNCTDYQARRLGVRYKDDNGKTQFVHMLNGTALAVSRALVSIIELFQQEDGSVIIPEALQPYCGFQRILPRK